MRITVRLFGPQAAAANRRQVDVAVDGATVCCNALRGALGRACPSIAKTLAGSRFAVNHQLVCDQHVIRAGDEVALIGMVSGG